MRQLPFLLTLLIGLFGACHSNDFSQKAPASRIVPQTDIAQQLQYQKAILDTLFSHTRDSIEVLVKLTDRADLVPFKDSVLPDETETCFHILRDSLKQIVAITESPYSESGDWFLTLTHYFDKKGRTFAFERQTNFFNSGCTDGVTYETKTEYFDSNFKLVFRNYKLTDEKGRDLAKDSCALLYEYDYKVLPHVKEYLLVNKIKKGR